jgi:hypothetical protein
MDRTFGRLDVANLHEVRHYTLSEVDRFLNVAGTPPGKYLRYADRLIGVCLAHGAAQHFVDLQSAGTFDNEVSVSRAEINRKGFRVLRNGRVINGINDLDVYFFFRQDEILPIPNRYRRKSLMVNLEALGERRLDFMRKGIPESVLTQAASDHPRDIIRAYIQESHHGRHYLSKKSLIGLHPDALFGQLAWQTRRLTSA